MTPKCPDCKRDQDDCCCKDEIESLRQQLAAALAVCKQKDDALEKIRGHIGLYNLFSCVGSDSYDPECADLNVGKCREIAIEALAIQPDDDALKTWLGEPIGDVKKHTGSLKDMAIIVWSGEQPAEGTKLYSPKGLK